MSCWDCLKGKQHHQQQWKWEVQVIIINWLHPTHKKSLHIYTASHHTKIKRSHSRTPRVVMVELHFSHELWWASCCYCKIGYSFKPEIAKNFCTHRTTVYFAETQIKIIPVLTLYKRLTSETAKNIHAIFWYQNFGWFETEGTYLLFI